MLDKNETKEDLGKLILDKIYYFKYNAYFFKGCLNNIDYEKGTLLFVNLHISKEVSYPFWNKEKWVKTLNTPFKYKDLELLIRELE
jgi:hypothetical protein